MAEDVIITELRRRGNCTLDHPLPLRISTSIFTFRLLHHKTQQQRPSDSETCATWLGRCNSAPYNRNEAGVHASMACCVCGGGAEDDISRGISFATPSFKFFFITTTSSVSQVPSISYVSAYLMSCSACVPGKYKSIASTIACANCEVGTYSAYLASVTCTGCPAGRDSPASSESQTSCICLPGFHQAEDMHGEPCDPCPAGTFKAARGSSGCQHCDPGAPSPSFRLLSCCKSKPFVCFAHDPLRRGV